ncbi:MAG: SdrD B-like domain-containing protein [Patescibacteria group bacterium]
MHKTTLWRGIFVVAFLIISLLGYPARTPVFSAVNLPYQDSFVDTDGNDLTVDGWVDSDGIGSNARLRTTSSLPGSLTPEHVRLRLSQSITQTIDTSGFDAITLSYYWRGTSDADAEDYLKVLWRVADTGNPNYNVNFTELASRSLNTTSWAQATSTLPISASHTLIEIRFLGQSDHVTQLEEALVDDVSVTGTAFTPGSVSIDKITNPSGVPQSFDFTLTGPVSIDITSLADTTPTSTISNLLPGTYTLVETVPAGWDFMSLNCTGAASGFTQTDNSVSFTLAQGEQVSCSFTNTKKGSITVTKDILSYSSMINPTNDVTPFTVRLDNGSAIDRDVAEGAPVTYQNLIPGSYTLTEILPTGYTITSFLPDNDQNPNNGTQLIVNPGEDVQILITNTQLPGTITVDKNVFASNGTTDVIDPHQFNVTLHGDNGHEVSGTVIEGQGTPFPVDPYVYYTVTETIDTAYAFAGCDAGHPICQVVTSPLSQDNVVLINNQKNGSITVIKNVLNPDGGEVSDNQMFTVLMNSEQRTIAEGQTGIYANLTPGTYTIEEINIPSGYTFGAFSIDEDQNSSNGSQITLTSGQVITLTATNRQQKGTITVHKNVMSYEGVDISDNAPFIATVIGQPNQQFSENTPAVFSVNPGCYAVGELDHPNYDFVSIDPSGEVCVTPGGSVSVTITNRPSSATITIHKVVQNPLGQSVADDPKEFNATVTGQTPQPLSINQNAVFVVGPGTYTIGEQDAPGYDLISITATQVTLSSGSSVDITITNRQRWGTIIVQKNVLNPDGGEVDDDTSFPVNTDNGQNGIVTELLQLTLTGVTPRVPVTVSEGSVPHYDGALPQTVTIAPGGTTTPPLIFVNRQHKATITVLKDVKNPLGEETADNHQFTANICGQQITIAENSIGIVQVNPGTCAVEELPDPDYDQDPNNPTSITVVSGEEKTITFVNLQKRGKIEIIKDVVNPDLGPAEDATLFTVTIDGVGSQPLVEGATTTFDNLLPGTYTISETAPSTHDLVDFSPSNTITIGSHETKPVTIRNRQHPATIIVHKEIVGPDGDPGVEDPHTFTASVDTDPINRQISEGNPATFTVYPGLRTVTEQPNSNYELVDITPSAQVAVAPDQIVEVTITNKPKLVMIKINKIVQDVDGVTTNDPHVFYVTVGSETKPLEQSTTTVFMLPAGTYTITEMEDLGYSVISGSPQTVQLSAGQSTTKTITNRQRTGKIVVVKDVIGPHGEDVHDTTPFQIQFNGGADQPIAESATTTFDNLVPGTYALTETQGQGYDAPLFSTTTPIILDPGETVEVKITNRQQEGSITGTKWEDINGDGVKDEGESGIPDVTIALGRVSGPETPEGRIPIEIVALSLTSINGAFTIPNVVPGQYTLFEEQRNGWQPTTPWHVDSFFDITYRIDLIPQQKPLVSDSFFDVFVYSGESVSTGIPSGCQPAAFAGSCGFAPLEFGNFQLGSISGMKWNDLNGDGIKDENEPGLQGWTITLNPGNTSTTTDENGSYSFESLIAGTYTVSETVQSGWQQTYPVNPGTHTVQITSGTVETGKNFGNRLRLGSIIIRKITIGDDGTFNFSGLGGFSITTINGVSTSTHDEIEPGIYEVSESLPSLWDLTNIECSDDNSEMGPVGSGMVSINLDPGESVTCTFTDTKRGKLIVQKTTYPAGDQTEFPIQILREYPGQGIITDGRTGIITDTQDKEFEIIPGGIYFVNEEPIPNGWEIVSNNCENIVAQPGETVVCEIVNKKAAHISITKTSIGDSGEFSFTGDLGEFNIETTQPDTPSTTSFDVFVPIAGQTITITETVPSGWSADQQSCVLENVMPGGLQQCAFTNTKQGRIIVDKVTNPSGDPQLFTFTPSWGEPFTLTDTDLPHDSGYLTPGSYSVDETVPLGWDLTSATCDDGSNSNAIQLDAGETVTCTFTNTKRSSLTIVKATIGGDDEFGFNANLCEPVIQTYPTFSLITENGSASVTYELPGNCNYSISEDVIPQGWGLTTDPQCSGILQPGEEKICEFINTKRPTLTVNKIITNDNGGIVTIPDFTLRIDGNQVTSGQTVELASGIHTVSEDPFNGYTGVIGGDCAPDGTITLAPGDTKICTVTNDDITPQLTVIKQVIKDNGGQLDPNNFTIQVTGIDVSQLSFPGSATGTIVTLDAGSYSVDEIEISGYTKTLSADCSGTIGLGEHKICTITNNDEQGALHVEKNLPNDNGGTATPDQFSFSVNGGEPIPFEPDGTNNFTVNAGEYHIVEVNPLSGYAVGYQNCENATVSNSGEATCIITNDDQQATITVTKVMVNDHGGTKQIDDFPLFIDGNPTTSSTTVPVLPGTHLITETNQIGYAASFSGDCDVQGNITVALGDHKTCIITNDDLQATITVTKVVINDNGGTKLVVDFPLFIDGNPTTSSTTVPVLPGAHLVTETNQLGYVATFTGDCDEQGNVTVTLGEMKTCTITNDDIAPTLTLIKTIINDHGGSATGTDFTIRIDGQPITLPSGSNPIIMIIQPPLDAGNHQVGEDPYPGYDVVFSGDCASDGTITLDIGDNKTCSITNDDQAATLTVIKHVVNDNGGTKVASDFTMNVAGTDVTNPSFPGDEQGTQVILDAGTYSVDEVGLPGYTKIIGENCAGTIVNGEHKICTITNDDQQATITVTKVVINDNGGTKLVADFPLFIDGNPTTSSSTVPVLPGNHIIFETNQSGYTAAINGDCDAQGNIAVALGEHKLCVITNNDQQATITVVKNVINDNGGTASTTDFALYVGQTQVGNGDPLTVNAGMYAISENGPAGYTASFSGDCTAGGWDITGTWSLTLNAGATPYVHSMTVNSFNPATGAFSGTGFWIANPAYTWNVTGTVSGSTISYHVVYTGINAGYSFDATGTIAPDGLSMGGAWDGGTWTASGSAAALPPFVVLAPGDIKECTITNDDQHAMLTVHKVVNNNHGGLLTPQDFILKINGNQATFGAPNTLNAGSYTVSEDQVSGYLGTISGDCAADGSVTLNLGDHKTCTITNNDQSATITVVKQVINDNGGIKLVADFPLFLDSLPVISSSTTDVLPGAHVVSETSQTGYSATLSGDCDAQGNITVALGEHKICSITNDDAQGILHVEKIITNDNGGTATSTQFFFTVNGGEPIQFEPDGMNDLALNAGEYDIVEVNPLSGYAVSYQNCDNAIVSNGGEVTCTITNNDQPASLTVIKLIINDNGGNASTTDFALFVGQTPVGNGDPFEVAPGNYVVSETGASGYAASYSGDCDMQGNVSIALGEHKVCTITNDDSAPSITLIKNVINDNGGNAEASDFDLLISGVEVESDATTTVEANVPIEINEHAHAGYSFVSITGDAKCPAALGGVVMLDEGEYVTCTITNDDQQATITVVKKVINDNGGQKGVQDFPLFIDSIATTSSSTVPVLPGTHLITETNQTGYAATFSGDCDAQGNVTVALGEHKVCSITNNDQQAMITVTKQVINDNGGSKLVGDFPLFIDGQPVTSGVPVPVDAGTHMATESSVAGYSRSFSGSCTLEAWDLNGLWDLDFTLSSDSSHRYHAMHVTSFDPNTGAFSGTGTTTGIVPPPAPILYIWTVTGTVSGNNITMTIAYNEIPGYTVSITGLLDGLGQMSGTFTDNGSATGTFTGTGAPEPLSGSIIVGVGESATCTITNNDEPATLTIEKTVLNTHGGTLNADAFTLRINGNVVPRSVAQALAPGTYTVSEDQVAGYAGTISGDCDADGNVTLNLGDHKTCTITNNDQGITITVVKKVINDNGGTKLVADFPLFLDSIPVTSSSTNEVLPGTHVVSETNQTGYAATFSGDCDAQGNVTVALGEHKVCSITNNDQEATITVVKKVINDNGGTKLVADFPLFIDGNPTTSSTTVPVLPGAHTITETGQLGYGATFTGDCDGDGHMTIALGEHKKCTITNNDGQAQLTMVKQVVNNNFGTAQPSEFAFMVGTTPAAHNQTVTIDAGTFAITEQGPQGYAASFSSSCANGSVTLAPGDQKTCTVTNDDIPIFGEIFGVKWDDLNQNGVRDQGEPRLQGWTITLNPGSRATTTDESGNYRFNQVTPGTYTISETIPASLPGQAGWVQTFPGGAGTHAVVITLAGEIVTGKDFGNFKYGTLSGFKYEDMNANGMRDANEPGLAGWTITLNPGGQTTTTDADGLYQFLNLNAGAYTITETPQPPLWHQSEPVSGNYNVTVTSGTNETHNFGNYRLGLVSGVKFEDVNGNSAKDTGEPLLAGWTITLLKGTTTVVTTITGAGGAYSFNNLIPGAYEVRETLKSGLPAQAGWVQTLPQRGTPYAVDVVSGTRTTDVDFGNFRMATLNGTKYNDRNNNRRKDTGEPGLAGWTIILVNLTTGEQRTTVTGANGAYQFTNLGPGKYLVREVLRSGWLPTSPANGVYNSVDVFVSGGTVTRHFGNRQLILPRR